MIFDNSTANVGLRKKISALIAKILRITPNELS